MNTINIYTDGSALKNPNGPGGWAAIICFTDGRQLRLSGAEPDTTNNRMEMTAALRGLEAVRPIVNATSAKVVLHTDSQYVQLGMSQWVRGWLASGWVTSTGKEVSNIDLWQRLVAAASGMKVEWKWVRGHVGHRENEVADQMAGMAARSKQGQVISLSAEEVASGQFDATTPTGRARATVIEVDTTSSDSEIAALIREHLGAAGGKSVRFRERMG